MTDDLLTSLRTDPGLDSGAPVRDVGDIHRRARALHTRRRLLVGATSATGIAAALAVAGVVLPQDAGTGGNPSVATYLGVTAAHAADGAEADCRLGYGSAVDLGDLDDRADIAALAVLFRDGTDVALLRGISAHQDEGQCPPPVPALVLYDLEPLRGISVWPDVANPYDGDTGLVSTQVRGVRGEFMTLDTGTRVLSWVEPDGERWLAEASGVDADELVAVLDAMQIGDDDTVSADLPDGFEAAPVSPPTTDLVMPEWTVQYGSPGAEWTADRVIVNVTEAYAPTAALAASWSGFTPSQVGSHVALYDAGDGVFGSLRWDADGRSYVLTGTGGIQRLVMLAEHLEPVAVDDPRLMDVPDLKDVPDTGN